MKNNREKYSDLLKDTQSYKENLWDSIDDSIKKDSIDIFLTIVWKKIKSIKEENISDEYKKKKIEELLDNAQDFWEQELKKKNKLKKEAIKDKYKIYILSLEHYFDEKLQKINNEILEDKADKIKNIEFSEDFKIPEDIEDLKEQFDDAINDLEALLIDSEWKEKEKYENAIFVLKQYKKNLEKIINDTKNFDAEKISDKIDSLVDQAENHKWNWPITLKLFNWVERTFRNKAEALNTLEEVKKQLSEEFISWSDIAWNIIKAPYVWVYKMAKSMIIWEEDSFLGAKWLMLEWFLDTFWIWVEKDGDKRDWDWISQVWWVIEMALWLGLWITWISLFTTFLWIHAWIPESILRRSKDLLSRTTSKLQYEDYWKTWKVISEPWNPEYKDYLEYQQREWLLEVLDEKLKTMDDNSPEYKKLERNIEILRKYKLSKTRTFYYLAHKISEWYNLGVLENLKFWKNPAMFFYNMKNAIREWWIWAIYNPFKDIFTKDKDWIRLGSIKNKKFPKFGWFYIWKFDSTKTYYDDTIKWATWTRKTPLQNWMDLFFKNKKIRFERVENKNIPKLVIEWNSEAKTDKYNFIINYIQWKKIKQEEKNKIIKNFEEYVEKLKESPKSVHKIRSDLVILLNESLWDQNEFIKDVSREIDDIKANKSKSIKSKVPYLKDTVEENKKIKALEHFQELLAKKEWIGTEKEFKTTLEDIKNNNTIVKENISTKLSWKKFEEIFNNILNKWENLLNNTDSIKNVLFEYTANDLENSTKSQYVKNIEDYIAYKVDNKIEKKAKSRLKNFLENIISWKEKIISEDKLHLEIWRIINWWLTETEIIEKIKNQERSSFSDIQKSNVKTLIEQIINNPDLVIKEDDIKTLMWEIQNGTFNTNSLDSLHLEKLDISDIKQKITDAEGMRDRDFEKKLREIWKTKDEFFAEVKETIKINENITNKNDVITELDKLRVSTDNWYTDLQIIHIIDRIKNWDSFETISKTKEASDKTLTLYKLLAPENKKVLEQNIDKIKNEIDSYNNLEKLDKLNQKVEAIKNNTYYSSIEKTKQNELNSLFEQAKQTVEDNFRNLSIDEQIDEIKKYKTKTSDFIKNILSEHIWITIDEINNSSLNNLEKVEKAKKLLNSIPSEIYSSNAIIKSNIDKLIWLEKIAILESKLTSLENEVRNQNPNKARLKTIMWELDKLYWNDLADNDLRDRIDILKTEINDTTSSPKKAPETKEVNKYEKVKKIYQNYEFRLRLIWENNLADKLSNELNSLNKSEDSLSDAKKAILNKPDIEAHIKSNLLWNDINIIWKLWIWTWKLKNIKNIDLDSITDIWILKDKIKMTFDIKPIHIKLDLDWIKNILKHFK